jgi:hypothetical protein
VCIFRDEDDFVYAEMLIGLGCCLSWVGLTRYLMNIQHFNIIPMTMYMSNGPVFKAIIGALPFMLGMNFLGVATLWKSNRFEDQSTSFFLLFSLMNGDILFDTYIDAKY